MKNPIIPAIMPEQFTDIEEMVGLVAQSVNMIQLDLMDGKYVSETTWPFVYTTDRDVEALKKEDGALPFWEEVDYELDLMVQKPEENLDTWLHLGAARVVFHYASVNDWSRITNLDHITRNFVKLGCAVTIHDNLEDIFPLIDNKTIDYIQVMGIAHIGYQGEPFEEEVLDIIEELRAKYPDLLITVDGGVSLDTIADLYDAGANEFVSGSGVYGGGAAVENISELAQAIGETTE